MIKPVSLGLIIYFSLVELGYTQQPTDAINFERAIENLLPQQDSDVDYNDLYDKLFALYVNRLDLNTAERTDLQSLFFLSEEQINAIISHRKKYGNFITLYELKRVEGLDTTAVNALLPFIKIIPPGNEHFKEKLSHPDINELLVKYKSDLERKKGYQEADSLPGGQIPSRYPGSAGQLFARYTYARPSAYSFGFTVEKDPGEKITWDPGTKRYGMDYYSFHGMIEGRGFLKRILVGDFNMDYGQGVIFGSGLRIGRGFEPITTIRRNNMGLRPYRSVYENKDFSGLAVECGTKFLRFSMFISHVARDGALKSEPDGSINNDPFVTYIQTMGLHRTPSELSAKQRVSDTSFGGNISALTNNKKLEVGLNGLVTRYSVPIVAGNRMYQRFQFSGIENKVGSIYANYYFRDGHVFSEVSTSAGGGLAISAGVIKSLSSRVQTSFHYRNYSRDFHSFYGSAFGVSSTTNNEEGIFWGLKIAVVRNLFFTASYDYYKFPWLKYRVDAPSLGNEFMSAMVWRSSDRSTIKFQYRQRESEENLVSSGDKIGTISGKVRRQLILDFEHDLDKVFSIRTRVQTMKVSFGQDHFTGVMLTQDVNASWKKTSCSVRYSLFDSEDYESRMYIFEKDVLYSFSMPSFYGQGIRYYLVVRQDITPSITGWMRISQTKYFDRETISSGLETIEGNTRTTISMQLRFRF